jgi:O-antigen/teichoic acid export membrane protein
VALGVGACASLLVPALLGPQWLAAAPVLQLMAMFGFLSVLTGNAGAGAAIGAIGGGITGGVLGDQNERRRRDY